MKKVLCISPSFPPTNAADMHRLRQSLNYYKEFGWEPVVFSVSPQYVEQEQDELLLDSIPKDIEVHYIKAFSTRWTRKLGLGNLGIRAWFQYYLSVSRYLIKNKVDLIFFTTTVFTLISLGPVWKRKFKIPFVIDLQDPWRNDYYLTLPSHERPPKFWFDYLQKKHLEAYTVPQADGIISVSNAYIDELVLRYPFIKNRKFITLPFGALTEDVAVARKATPVNLDKEYINIIYIGRGGEDMHFALSAMFNTFRKGLDSKSALYKKVRFSFFGTSYAAQGKGQKTILPIAEKYGVESYVQESTDRLAYFTALSTMLHADVLFVPGSIDEKYTASKIFPYILVNRPLIAIFNEKSSVIDILKDQKDREVVTFRSENSIEEISESVSKSFSKILEKLPLSSEVNDNALAPYTAKEMTRKQCAYFDHVFRGYNQQ